MRARTASPDRGLPLAASAILVAFAGLHWLERRRPLRRRIEPPTPHLLRNLALAAASAATVHLLEQPVAMRAARFAERHRFGLTHRLRLRGAWRTAAAVVLMDYTLYLWHVLTHRVPFLWRFHQVHHIDRDLDASTALRFHFGEMALSTSFRAAQILLIGTSPRALGLWQRLTLLSILFHHSNVRLPRPWERRLAWLVTTPRLHGIHHSVVAREVNSNWSSGLTLWDRLHGTLRAGSTRDALEIGVPGHRRRRAVTLGKMLALPFRRTGATSQHQAGML